MELFIIREGDLLYRNSAACGGECARNGSDVRNEYHLTGVLRIGREPELYR